MESPQVQAQDKEMESNVHKSENSLEIKMK